MKKMNDDLMKAIHQLKELLPIDEIDLSDGVTESQILESEKELGTSMPADLRLFYKQTNGFFAYGREILPLLNKDEGDSNNLTHVNKWEKEEAEHPIPSHYLPFSPNGRGDYYCFDLKTRSDEGICKIIFWQWDYSPFNSNDIEITNPHLLGWLEELIEEVQEEYG